MNLIQKIKTHQERKKQEKQELASRKKQEKLEEEACLVYSLIENADSNGVYGCLHFLKQFRELVGKSEQKDIYDSGFIPEFVKEKLFGEASKEKGFEERLKALVEENKQSLEEFSLNPEKIYAELLEQKKKEYGNKLVEIVSKMEKSLSEGFNLKLIQGEEKSPGYEQFKEAMQEDFEKEPEFFIGFQKQRPTATGFELVQREVPLDVVFSELAVGHYLKAMAYHLENHLPQELASDGFLNFYQDLAEKAWLYAYPDSSLAYQKNIKGALKKGDQKLQEKMESVQEEIEGKQDWLYQGIEKILEEPSRYNQKRKVQEVFLDTFRKFASYSLKYGLLLEEDKEGMEGQYEKLKLELEEAIKSEKEKETFKINIDAVKDYMKHEDRPMFIIKGMDVGLKKDVNIRFKDKDVQFKKE